MKLFILSAAVSFDTKTFILLLKESYFSTVRNVDRVGFEPTTSAMPMPYPTRLDDRPIC